MKHKISSRMLRVLFKLIAPRRRSRQSRPESEDFEVDTPKCPICRGFLIARIGKSGPYYHCFCPPACTEMKSKNEQPAKKLARDRASKPSVRVCPKDATEMINR